MNVHTMSWLMGSVVYMGFLIFVLMGIKLFVFTVIGCWQTGRPEESSSRVNP